MAEDSVIKYIYHAFFNHEMYISLRNSNVWKQNHFERENFGETRLVDLWLERGHGPVELSALIYKFGYFYWDKY